MREFRITAWSVRADMPGKTAVTVDVIHAVAGGISARQSYELQLDQQFDAMSDAFVAAVGGVLQAAGLL